MSDVKDDDQRPNRVLNVTMDLVKMRAFLSLYGFQNVTDEEIVKTVHNIMEKNVFGLVAVEMRILRSNPAGYSLVASSQPVRSS